MSWQSSSFWQPPPTMWTTSTGRPDSSPADGDGLRVRDGRASRGCSGRPRPRTPAPAARSRAGRADPGRHVARRQEHRRRRRRRPGRRPGSCGRLGQQRVLVGRLAGLRQVAQRLLQQPQAADVAQVADPAVDAALVGEVRRPARLGQHRLRPAPPRPATRCRRRCRRSRRSAAGTPDHRRRGVVRPDRDHRGRRRPGRSCSATVGRNRPDHLARLDQRREQAGRQDPRAATSSRPTRSGSGRPAGRWSRRW